MAVTVEPSKSIEENNFIAKSWPQFLAAFISSLGAFILGTVLGWSAPAVPVIQAGGEFGNLDSSQISWITSLAILGCLLSTLPGGLAVERIGRKRTMLVSCLPLFVGWLQIAFADSVRMLYFGRLIVGFFGGIFSQAVPIYLAEIAEKRLRGQLGSWFALYTVTAVLVTYILGSFLSWRELSLIYSALPLILFGGMCFMPESPAFFMSRGKEAEAGEALMWLRGAQKVGQIESELKEMKAGSSSDEESEGQKEMKLGDWFSGPTLKPLLISVVLMVINQWSGVGIAIFYTVQIFESAGSTMSPNLSTIIVGAAQVLGVALSGQVIDRLGRRILLISSCICVVLCFIPMGIFYFIKDVQNGGVTPETLAILPLICLVTFMVLFSIGLGPIPWIITGELMAPNAKGMATAIATTFNWLAAFILAKSFDDVSAALGLYSCYWIFAGICLFGAIFVFLFLPETKQKSHQEIALHFNPKLAKPTGA